MSTHTGIGASDIHIVGKFRDERYGKTLGEKKITILRMAVESVQLARQFVDDVEFYAEDASRSDRSYLFEMLQAVIEAGATVVNIPDTTGYAVPEQYGDLIRAIRENVPNIGRGNFEELARAAEKNCPISKLLNAEITMNFTLA